VELEPTYGRRRHGGESLPVLPLSGRGDGDGSDHEHGDRRALWKAQPEAVPSPQPMAES
jgi:hypothetical protein